MKTATFYDNQGKILGTISSDDDNIVEQGFYGYACVEGHFSNDYYIDNGKPCLKPADPSTAALPYSFDYETKTWFPDIQAQCRQQRQLRDSLLAEIDAIPPAQYAAFGESKRAQIQFYRQCLLDVPQQANFPGQIEWPAKPQWL